MAEIPANDVTEVQTGNGQQDGETKIADFANRIKALLGAVTVSTSAPLSGDGSSGSPITMTQAALATVINAGGAVCDAIRACVAGVAAITDNSGVTGVVVKDGSGLKCISPSDLGIGGDSSGGGGTDWAVAASGQSSITLNAGASSALPAAASHYLVHKYGTADGAEFLRIMAGGATLSAGGSSGPGAGTTTFHYIPLS